MSKKLVPFNRGNSEVSGADPFFHMLDDFFQDPWFAKRNWYYDSFKLDVKEDEKAYTVEAEMPGIDKKDIQISLDDERLVISVNHDESKETNTDQYLHKERKTSSMSRAVYLAGAASDGITAKLEDGVLRIVVPKDKSTNKSNQIKIE